MEPNPKISRLWVTMTRNEQRAVLRELLSSGENRDGVALDVIMSLPTLDGELFTDGEILDLIGDAIDIWRKD
jgi:hypothetical protein